MARMPQIPQPELAGRPGGRLSDGEGTQINVNEVEAPLEEGARAAATVGNELEQLQSTREAAQAKLQRARDQTTAIQLKGQHELDLANLSAQLQQQYWDKPEDYLTAFQDQARQLTDSKVKAAPTPGAQLAFNEQAAEANNRAMLAAHGWMVQRQAQIVGDTFAKKAQAAIVEAQNTPTTGGLSLAIARAQKDARPIAGFLHTDPDKLMPKLAHDQTAAWVEANAEDRPRDVLAALRDKDGVVYKNLTDPKERDRYEKLAEAAWKTYDQRKATRDLMEYVDAGGKHVDALHAGDYDARNQFQVIKAAEQKIDAIRSDNQLSPDAKREQVAAAEKQVQMYQLMNKARLAQGLEDKSFNQEKTAELYKRLVGFTKAKEASPQTLRDLVDFRYDLVAAQAAGIISPAVAKHYNTMLTGITGKAVSQQSKNTGLLLPGWLGGFRGEPVQAGSRALEDALKSPLYKRLSDDEKNQARVEFVKKFNYAQQSGGAFSAADAQRAAAESLRYVAGH